MVGSAEARDYSSAQISTPKDRSTMATMTDSPAAADSSPSPPSLPPSPSPSSLPPSLNHPNGKFLGETTPFVDYVVQQAQFYEKAFNEAFDSALQASKSRISRIRSTSSAHFHQTLVIFSPLHGLCFVWFPRINGRKLNEPFIT